MLTFAALLLLALTVLLPSFLLLFLLFLLLISILFLILLPATALAEAVHTAIKMLTTLGRFLVGGDYGRGRIGKILFALSGDLFACRSGGSGRGIGLFMTMRFGRDFRGPGLLLEKLLLTRAFRADCREGG